MTAEPFLAAAVYAGLFGGLMAFMAGCTVGARKAAELHNRQMAKVRAARPTSVFPSSNVTVPRPRGR